MERKINTVCLVDDDDIYQFVASLEIKKTNLVDKIILFSDGQKAINFFISEKEN